MTPGRPTARRAVSQFPTVISYSGHLTVRRAPIPFRLAMASAANNSINFIITGDEDPQMDGQEDPVQEERQEEMYTHVFEGQCIFSASRIKKRECMRRQTEMMRTVLSNEARLFNQDERLIFSRYGKLSCKSHLISSYSKFIRPDCSGCPPHSHPPLHAQAREMVPLQRPRWLPETLWGQDFGYYGRTLPGSRQAYLGWLGA